MADLLLFSKYSQVLYSPHLTADVFLPPHAASPHKCALNWTPGPASVHLSPRRSPFYFWSRNLIHDYSCVRLLFSCNILLRCHAHFHSLSFGITVRILFISHCDSRGEQYSFPATVTSFNSLSIAVVFFLLVSNCQIFVSLADKVSDCPVWPVEFPKGQRWDLFHSPFRGRYVSVFCVYCYVDELVGKLWNLAILHNCSEGGQCLDCLSDFSKKTTTEQKFCFCTKWDHLNFYNSM